MKKLMLPIVFLLLVLSGFNSFADKPYPVEDVKVLATEPEVLLEAEIILRNGCLFTETGTAVVSEEKNVIELQQQVEKTGQICTQRLKTVNTVFNLSDIEDGTYLVVDGFDNKIVEAVEIE